MSHPHPDGDAIVVRAADLGHGGHIVLHHIDLRVPAGQHLVLRGGNGSGKSTLLAALSGLLAPLAGQLTVLGLDPLRARRRLHGHVGHLGHGDPTWPMLTARENLEVHAGVRGLDAAAVTTALSEAGLAAVADRRVGTYSHGMVRRLGLAKALLGKPRLLLLDEPDSGLDSQAREALVARLEARRDRTVVVTTHHAEAWRPFAHRILDIRDGGVHDTAGVEGTA